MSKDKKLVIVGAGEMALIAYEYFTHDSDYQVAAFSVEQEYLKTDELEGLPVVPLERLEDRFPPTHYEAFVAIPASQLNRLRTRLYTVAKRKGYSCASYISSRAFVWRNVPIGENSFIFEHNTVQPFVSIGANVVLWSGNHIGHRSVIEDNSFLSSHVVVSGYCRIGSSSFIGVNSTFNDHTSVARDCIVASGSLVVKPLTEPGKVYYGAPAKEMQGKTSFDVGL